MEPIEKIKARLNKKVVKEEKKIIKFVPTEEIKKMDFSEELSGIGDLFNAM